VGWKVNKCKDKKRVGVGQNLREKKTREDGEDGDEGEDGDD
jgi:hypothetical protein